MSSRNGAHGATPPNPDAGHLVPAQTEDGSMTIESSRFGQAYHSRHGARTESLHVFIEAGFNHRLTTGALPATLRILELGFGTGLNALLTLCTWRDHPLGRRPKLEYCALEPLPIPGSILAQIDPAADAGADLAESAALHAREGAERHEVHWAEEATFTRIKRTWQDFAAYSPYTFDLIYFDAFAPDSQPELWTETRFKEAHNLLNEGGVLVTYCAKGAVRRAMESAGLAVERLPGPPGKREMLRATRPKPEDLPMQRFNVRVYFFLIAGPGEATSLAPGDQVLVSDEWIAGRRCTKWPGGGLEFGEGPKDCARREAMEELGQPIVLGDLVHATGGCVRSAWRPTEQVLCHYYLARLQETPAFRIAQKPFDFDGASTQSLRWETASEFDPESLSFATDREAWMALTAHWGHHSA